MKKLSLVAASGLAVAGLALAGCSSSGPTVTVAAPSASSTASPSPPGTAGSAGTTVDGKELSTRMKAAMQKAGTGKATMTVNGTVSTSADMSFDYSDPKTPKVQMTMSVASMDLEAVVDGTTFYIKGFPSALTGGKPWAKLDPNGTDALSQALKQSLSASPDDAVDALAQTTVTLKSTGGGTTTYQVTDLKGQSGATMDLTVGADDLPQRSVVSVSGQTVTVTYSDWGAPVSISVPDPSQVGTLTLPKG